MKVDRVLPIANSLRNEIASSLTTSSCVLAGLVLASVALPVLAQNVASGEGGALIAPLSDSDGNSGSGTGPKKAWSIKPRIAISETVTDNVDASSARKQADQITEITPAIFVTAESAHLKGFFDYQLHEMIYARDSTRNQSQQLLNSFATLEAIDKWLFVDASGVITQQNISAFGTQAASNSNVNSNRTETSSFQLSPYVLGKLGGYADYEVRYKRSTTRSKSSLASDVDAADIAASIGGGVSQSNFSWLIESSWQNSEYGQERATNADRFRGFLSYRPDAQLKLSLIGGREANNYTSVAKESQTTHGYSIDWSPNERTKLSASKESRFFGEGHSLSFNYRSPLMAIAYSDSRDVTVLPNQVTNVGLGSLYDLIDRQYASRFPDPVIRAQQVNYFFQQTGLPPNVNVIAGFLTSQVSVDRLQALSLVSYGVRNVITLSVTQSQKQSLGIVTGLSDDFSLSPSIKQRGFNVNWAYRLSALSNINATVSQQDSISPSARNLDTKQKSLNVAFSTKVGSVTTATLGLRRAIFDSLLTPYSENAVIGTLVIQF